MYGTMELSPYMTPREIQEMKKDSERIDRILELMMENRIRKIILDTELDMQMELSYQDSKFEVVLIDPFANSKDLYANEEFRDVLDFALEDFNEVEPDFRDFSVESEKVVESKEEKQ